MNLDIEDGISLISEAVEKSVEEKEEKKAWEMWVSIYPNMRKDSFIPFSEFYQKQTRQSEPVAKRSTEDILRDAEVIQLQVSGGE